MWSDQDAAFLDYDWQLAQKRPQLSAATAVPLYAGVASPHQAQQAAATIRARLLVAGGIATTEQISGQQWDAPNGWAPLQWMAIQGLYRYGERELSQEIARRWLQTVHGLYAREWKLVEKYTLHTASDSATGGSGGEYPLQDGFGWTNGITRKLMLETNSANTRTGRSQER